MIEYQRYSHLENRPIKKPGIWLPGDVLLIPLDTSSEEPFLRTTVSSTEVHLAREHAKRINDLGEKPLFPSRTSAIIHRQNTMYRSNAMHEFACAALEEVENLLADYESILESLQRGKAYTPIEPVYVEDEGILLHTSPFIIALDKSSRGETLEIPFDGSTTLLYGRRFTSRLEFGLSDQFVRMRSYYDPAYLRRPSQLI